MNILLSPIAGFLGGWFRRWFGGWSFGITEESHPILYKIVDCRALQTVFLLSLFFVCFLVNNFWIATPLSALLISWGIPTWVIALALAGLFQGFFYAPPHGPAFDEGRGGKPDATLIARYKRHWWNKVCEWIIPEKYWYGFIYDNLWMVLRYTSGTLALIPFIWSFNIMWLGVIATAVYAFCWTISERDSWLITKMKRNGFFSGFVDGPTSLAEVVLGTIVGLWLMLM